MENLYQISSASNSRVENFRDIHGGAHAVGIANARDSLVNHHLYEIEDTLGPYTVPSHYFEAVSLRESPHYRFTLPTTPPEVIVGRIHFGKNEGYRNVSKRPTQETLDELYDLFGWYYVDI